MDSYNIRYVIVVVYTQYYLQSQDTLETVYTHNENKKTRLRQQPQGKNAHRNVDAFVIHKGNSNYQGHYIVN